MPGRRMSARRYTMDSTATDFEENIDKQIKQEIEESLIKSKKSKNELTEEK